MKGILAVVIAGAAAAAPAISVHRPTCAEAYAKTRVSVSVRGSTMRELFKQLEGQTGYPVSPECSCGALQRVVDEPEFYLLLQDVRAWDVLKLATAGMIHCGGWRAGEDGVYLECGLRERRN